MLRERLPTPSPPLLSVPNRRHSDLRCALAVWREGHARPFSPPVARSVCESQ